MSSETPQEAKKPKTKEEILAGKPCKSSRVGGVKLYPKQIVLNCMQEFLDQELAATKAEHERVFKAQEHNIELLKMENEHFKALHQQGNVIITELEKNNEYIQRRYDKCDKSNQMLDWTIKQMSERGKARDEDIKRLRETSNKLYQALILRDNGLVKKVTDVLKEYELLNPSNNTDKG